MTKARFEYDKTGKVVAVPDENGYWSVADLKDFNRDLLKCQSLGVDPYSHDKPNWLSIKKASECLFSRRNGYKGKIILGYSVRLRLFGRDII